MYLFYGRKRFETHFRGEKAGSVFFFHFRMPQKYYDSQHFQVVWKILLFPDPFAPHLVTAIENLPLPSKLKSTTTSLQILVYDYDEIF